MGGSYQSPECEKISKYNLRFLRKGERAPLTTECKQIRRSLEHARASASSQFVLFVTQMRPTRLNSARVKTMLSFLDAVSPRPRVAKIFQGKELKGGSAPQQPPNCRTQATHREDPSPSNRRQTSEPSDTPKKRKDGQFTPVGEKRKKKKVRPGA